jgi:hypothetical protein
MLGRRSNAPAPAASVALLGAGLDCGRLSGCDYDPEGSSRGALPPPSACGLSAA